MAPFSVRIHLVFFAWLLALAPWASNAQNASDYESQVQKMYIAYYGRPGDQAGVDYWVNQLAVNNGDLTAIIDAFGNSREFTERFGTFDFEELVHNIYQQLFGRLADPEGLAFYVGNLEAGTMSLATVALNVADGARPDNDDGMIITNKLRVAARFTESVAMQNLAYGLNEIVYAQQILNEVTPLSESVDAALELLDESLALFPDLDPIRVTLSLENGDIVLELLSRQAPITATNFLAYVDSGAYDGVVFHRVIPGFVIQGGGFLPGFNRIQTFAPIVNESSNGLSNLRGTVAMARTSDPDSATSQFYINLVDNTNLDFRSGTPGYAVFAEVVEGMDLVDAIATVDTGRFLTSIGTFDDVPLEDIVIRTGRRNE